MFSSGICRYFVFKKEQCVTELKKDLTWKAKALFPGHKRACCRACKLDWNSPALSSLSSSPISLSSHVLPLSLSLNRMTQNSGIRSHPFLFLWSTVWITTQQQIRPACCPSLTSLHLQMSPSRYSCPTLDLWLQGHCIYTAFQKFWVFKIFFLLFSYCSPMLHLCD